MGYGFGPYTDNKPSKGKHGFGGPVHGGPGYNTITCPYCGKAFRPQSSPPKGPGAGSGPGFTPGWNKNWHEREE